MPRKPSDYSNTHFYKICCKDLDITDIYVGHTTDFRKRKTRHKHVCLNENHNDHNLTVYQFIRQHNGWDNWEMVLIVLNVIAENEQTGKTGIVPCQYLTPLR